MAEFKIKSHNNENSYIVDTITLSCSCPHYQYRLKYSGGFCKHIQEILKNPNKYEQVKNDIIEEDIEMIKFIKNDNDAVNFVEKFGELTLNKLKCSVVFEKHGLLHLL